MAAMTDPGNALALYQQAFAAGVIPLQPCRLDPSLLMAVDHPNGKKRFSYMRFTGTKMTALVMFAQDGMEEGGPIFNIGYAVDDCARGRGLAQSTLVAALAELEHGLKGANVPVLNVEAVINIDHIVSQRVAATIFPDAPKPIIDSGSGLPALHYYRSILLNAPRA
ncbi:hypothetical protein GCM10011534_35710 [Pseudooceanicola nanhaiensis]|jgi:hypothetical protein|uniref:Uncharacterized protein n=1 Tax=Pseudooceanicola nanhaiensis TaxID=375761 RepID=A0A917WKB2_9RHOB|nr:hypothetical protein [Pseudooceanicola nanhaiensis]GGM10433.1 hypothetical protein GCM10011534_35710 [Pseudooceanicola nanhaiensis]